MPDTQICRHCKSLWPAELLFSIDGECPRCQANRPPARSLAIDEFEAEAELRAAIEDTEAELAGLRASLATYSGGPSKVQELRNDEGTVVGVQWEWIPCQSTHPRADNVVCVFRLDHAGEHRCGEWSWINGSSKDGGKA